MTDDSGAVKLEVLVYPDGGTQLSVPPMDDPLLAQVLEAAAVALRGAADGAVRDREPVTCAECGERAVGAAAAVSGVARLLPCGHSTG